MIEDMPAPPRRCHGMNAPRDEPPRHPRACASSTSTLLQRGSDAAHAGPTPAGVASRRWPSRLDGGRSDEGESRSFAGGDLDARLACDAALVERMLLARASTTRSRPRRRRASSTWRNGVRRTLPHPRVVSARASRPETLRQVLPRRWPLALPVAAIRHGAGLRRCRRRRRQASLSRSRYRLTTRTSSWYGWREP
jgi:hypothetical protein